MTLAVKRDALRRLTEFDTGKVIPQRDEMCSVCYLQLKGAKAIYSGQYVTDHRLTGHDRPI
jgi:hypothetical protein